MIRETLSRREWLRLASAGVVGHSVSGWFGRLAAAAADLPRKRACILLWLNGGPSQMDTFDLKPGHENGGPFREIATAATGVKVSEHLPKLAGRMKHAALVRSMTSKEGDHGLATFFNHTGYPLRGPIQYPSFGSVVAKQLGADDAALPNFVSIAPFRAFNPAAHGPGFLGPRYAPLIVGETTFAGPPQPGPNDADRALQVEDLALPAAIKAERFDARWGLAAGLQRDFVAGHPDPAARSHQTAYERAAKLMRSAAATALKLDDEPAKLRDGYGRNVFGQGCLLARRLVETGVPFVEVAHSGQGVGWDTHTDNFERVKQLSQTLDAGWSALIDDLKDRGLLDSTLILCLGEFGRTPKINGSSGRDHFPYAWSAALAGGGIRGGQAVGRTSKDGSAVEDRPVTVPDLLATACQALGIDPASQNPSNTGRPISVVESSARPVGELLA